MTDDKTPQSAAAWSCSRKPSNIFDRSDAATSLIRLMLLAFEGHVAGDHVRAYSTQDRALLGHCSWLHFECVGQIDSWMVLVLPMLQGSVPDDHVRAVSTDDKTLSGYCSWLRKQPDQRNIMQAIAL